MTQSDPPKPADVCSTNEITGGECAHGCCAKIPCDLCTGDSATFAGVGQDRRRLTSQEWCMEMDTCAAMIDWDKVYGND